jgi:hypothetical protein
MLKHYSEIHADRTHRSCDEHGSAAKRDAGPFLRQRGREEHAMTDSLENRGPEDRSRISVKEDWELKFWTKELGVSADALRAAIKAVGTSVEDVRARLES